MSRMQRIKSFLEGLLILICALALFLDPADGYELVVWILCVTLLLSGLHYIIYYLTMARHMVGGQGMLVRGVIALDLGLFTLALENVPTIYIMLYLMVGHMFSGVVGVLRSLEARKLGAPSWKSSMASGIGNILVAVLCLLGFRSQDHLVYIYASGLLSTAGLRFAASFRRTAIAYIP